MSLLIFTYIPRRKQFSNWITAINLSHFEFSVVVYTFFVLPRGENGKISFRWKFISHWNLVRISQIEFSYQPTRWIHDKTKKIANSKIHPLKMHFHLSNKYSQSIEFSSFFHTSLTQVVPVTSPERVNYDLIVRKDFTS